VREYASALAHIDCLSALAKLAKERDYICPLVDESDTFEVEGARHPIIEATLPGTFIPNDILFGPGKRLALITGPNMAGKSTYLREAALIAILAQMGSFVPAKKAHIGVIDKVFSRIGASDDLTRGQSTFMVEMTEAANILNNATDRSFVILDEIGRGTSTFDGISIAWAVAEYLLTTPGKKAKTLFATHYLELTELAEKLPGAFNLSVSVHEDAEGIVFLHKIVPGMADKSYGIHVARLAGLPHAALKRAEEKLIELETTSPPPQKTAQLELFSAAAPKPCLRCEEIENLDLNTLTPLDALNKLFDYKNR
jgi:DNA mismatch repair protein MutS